MEFRFDAQEWAGRTPEERARQCRSMADRARRLVETAPSSELKRAHSKIAAEWETLADEIDGGPIG